MIEKCSVQVAALYEVVPAMLIPVIRPTQSCETVRLKVAAVEYTLHSLEHHTSESDTRVPKAVSTAPLPLLTGYFCCGMKDTVSGASVRGLIPSLLKPLPSGGCSGTLGRGAPTRDCSASICWEVSASLRSCTHAKDIPGCWKSPGNIAEIRLLAVVGGGRLAAS